MPLGNQVVAEGGQTWGSHNPRVLIIEDTPSNQMVLKVMLKRLGMAYDVVSSAEAGLASFKDLQQEIILLDIRLPDLNGKEVTRRLRQIQDPDNPPYIIAQTAYALDGQREEFLEAGMDDYVSKPISLESFAEAIGRAIEALQR
ncbi:MAG: response regulator [Opitutales bacterium]